MNIATSQNTSLKFLQRFKQMFLYGAIGLGALALELAVFYVLVQEASLGILVSNTSGVLAGLIFGFTLNARYNFQVHDRRLERFLRYGLVAFGGYILTTSLIFGFTEYLHLAPFNAKLLSLPLYFLFQYNCNRLFTFGTSMKLPLILKPE